MTSLYSWSKSAGSNGNSDTAISWPEGQTPGSVNDSARAMMGRTAEFRDDISGAILATGTANGIVVTANSGFTSLANGRIVAFRASADNTGPATLNVNSLGAKSIRKMSSSGGDIALSGGELKSGATFLCVYNASLNASAGGWQLIDPALGTAAFKDDTYFATAADALLKVDGVKHVTSRTALKALATATYTTVILRESGREGTFVFKAGDYATLITDDAQEGIYIKATDTASSAGAWVREFSGPAQIEWFGAVADGATDNETALEAAFKIGGKYGVPLMAGPGTFLIEGTVNWTISAPFSMMAAPAAVFKASSSLAVDAKVFYPVASSGASFHWNGGKIDGADMPARSSGAPDLIYISGANFASVTVENVWFYNNADRSGSAGDGGLFIAECDDIVVTNCRFQGAVDNGLYVSGDSSQTLGRRCIAANNIFLGCSVGYISKRAFEDQVVSDNIAVQCTYPYVVGAEADTTKLPGKKATIVGNLARECTNGIVIRVANGTVCSGNRIEDYGLDDSLSAVAGHGISLEGAAHCVVTGNVVCYTSGRTPHASSRGINLTRFTWNSIDYESQYNLIANNVIQRSATAVREGAGVTDFNLFLDNQIYDTTTRATMLGANSILRDIDSANPRAHFRLGASGGTATAGVHELLENDTSHLSQVLLPNTAAWSLLMGDSDSATVARMSYSHTDDVWLWRAGGSGNVLFIAATYLEMQSGMEIRHSGSVVVDKSKGLRLPSYTAASIAAIGNAVNTADKAAGKMVWDTTNNRVMVASGSTAASAWYVADASANVVPA